MKKTLVLLVLFCCSMFASAQVGSRKILTNKYTLEDVKKDISTDKSWVNFPKYDDRLGWDKIFGTDREKLIIGGEQLLDYEWKVTTFTSYLDYRRIGLREPMEKTFNMNIRHLSQLLLAELAEGKGRFMDQIINGSMMLCEMTSWSLSAHLVVQPSRSPMPNHKHHVIDLVSGELSSLLAWTNFFMKSEFDKIEPEISQRIVYELNRKTIEPYMDGNKFWWMALGKAKSGSVNNWNPWCNSNVLTTALLTISDENLLSEVVYKTMRSIDEFFDYVKADGACEEGPSYWVHAAGKAFDYLYLLDQASNGKLSVLDDKLIKDQGEYIVNTYIGDGWMVNFSDGEAKAKLNYYHIHRYGKAVDSQKMMQFAAYLDEVQPYDYRITRDFFDTLAGLSIKSELKTVPSKLIHDKYTWYNLTEFAYFTNKNVFFASKGGHNGESHNHNDVGSFILYFKNNPVFIDAGVGTYNSKTFSTRRYEMWHVQSGYHSLPVINGVEQKNGKKYKVENVVCNGKAGKFTLDIAKAYPEDAAVKSWKRSYLLKNTELVIEDSFELLDAKEANEIHFMTASKFEKLSNGVLNLVVDGKNINLVYDAKKMDVSTEEIELTDIRFSKFWGPKLYKIIFRAKDLKLKDKYTFNIKF